MRKAKCGKGMMEWEKLGVVRGIDGMGWDEVGER
jgi:hypothetical protein